MIASQTRTSTIQWRSPVRIWEYSVPLLGSLSLLVSCVIVSKKKYFWNDELFSYYLLADRSFFHMLVAFHDKINNSPPLYFIVGWIWAHLFGASELSLRLFSSLSMCLALWLVWVTLRRSYGFYATSIGVLSVFCTSSIVLSQNAEARMYGLFLAAAAWCFFLYDAACRKREAWPGLLLGTACAHVALVNSHLFGLFYSGALLLALIVTDCRFKVLRAKLYLAVVLSWLSLLAYVPSFLVQADAGNPRYWPPIPNLRDLVIFSGMSSSSMLNLIVFVALLLIAGLLWLTRDFAMHLQERSEAKTMIDNRDSEASLLTLTYMLLALPVFVWIVSRLVKPIFYDRYMVPSTFGWSILLACTAARLLPEVRSRERAAGSSEVPKLVSWILLLLLVAGLLAYPLLYARSYWPEKFPGVEDTRVGYPDLPIVVQESHDFMMRVHYSPHRSRYFFILDWPTALSPASGIFGPEEYKQIQAMGRNYPELQRQILESEAFLAKHTRFLVLDYLDFDKRCPTSVKGISTPFENIHCPQWVEARLLHNPQYKVERVGQTGQHAMLLVQRQ